MKSVNDRFLSELTRSVISLYVMTFESPSVSKTNLRIVFGIAHLSGFFDDTARCLFDMDTTVPDILRHYSMVSCMCPSMFVIRS